VKEKKILSPKLHEKMIVPTHGKIVFKPSQKLRKAVFKLK
jgi:nucleoid DNA-binding protein